MDDAGADGNADAAGDAVALANWPDCAPPGLAGCVHVASSYAAATAATCRATGIPAAAAVPVASVAPATAAWPVPVLATATA